jgi:hypothetical protein
MAENTKHKLEVVRSINAQAHLKTLEAELKESGCERLRAHIRQLKAAWGLYPRPQAA